MKKNHKKLFSRKKGKTKKKKQSIKTVPSDRYFKSISQIPPAPLLDNKTTEHYLQRTQYLCRGFGKRHLNKLLGALKEEKASQDLLSHVKYSFLYFKSMRILCPEHGKDLLWIFKHFLTLEGQKRYKDLYDGILEVGYNHLLWHERISGCNSDDERLMNYFNTCSVELWLPIKSFPPILFEKKRMDLCFVPLKSEVPEIEIRNLFFNYIGKLSVDDLFIPPYDCLHKIGNSLTNDGGTPIQDWYRPQSYSSGFLYQYFLAQPLSPREVWLPDRHIKNNNMFWMIIGKQFLKKSPVYPPSDQKELWNKIKGKMVPGNIRFDISGFGFQFPRRHLYLMASVIQELYPVSQMDDMVEEFNYILNNVVVEKGARKIYPPRGIGLGYYETLKTLCILAILDEYDPISVYGDQGILPEHTAIEAISRLISLDYILKWDKIEFTSDITGRMLWAGSSMSSVQLIRTKDVSNAFVGSLFGRFHWERKNSLVAFFMNNKTFYKRYKKRVCRLYDLLYGYEFYKGDIYSHPSEGGICIDAPITVGTSKSFIVNEYLRPYENFMFEFPFATPFKKRDAKVYPHSIGKKFQLDRMKAYKNFDPISSYTFFYSSPRIEYNDIEHSSSKLLPEWCELQFLLLYNASSGTFTHGCPPENVKDTSIRYKFADDPFRARARGGYKILDPVFSNSPCGKEREELGEFLSQVENRQLYSISRADKEVPLLWGSDPLYFNTNLLEKYESKSVSRIPAWKRKYDDVVDEETRQDQDHIQKKILETLSGNVRDGIYDSLSTALSGYVHIVEEIVNEDDYLHDLQESGDVDDLYEY